MYLTLMFLVFFQADFDVEKVAIESLILGEKEQMRLKVYTNHQIDLLESTENATVGVAFKSKAEKANMVNDLKAIILKLKKTIRGTVYHVVNYQVLEGVGGNTYNREPRVGELGKVNKIYVRQITGKDTFSGEIPPINVGRPDHYFFGIDTSSLVDGKSFDFDGLLYVEGNHTYTNTQGASRTVLKLRALKQNEVEAFKKTVEAKRTLDMSRVWLDLSGKSIAEATLAGFDSRNVELEKSDGETIKFPLLKLSKADQKVVRVELGLDKFPDLK